MTAFDEFEDLRPQFAMVDKSDPVALRRWFDSHPYLKTTEHAIVARRSLQYIRDLKILAGLGGRKPAHNPPLYKRRTINILKAPENWDNEEWLREATKTYTILAIAEATGVSRRSIYRRLDKYKIPQKGLRNKYHTEEWIREHYIEKRLSQTKCAKLAGIAQQTFGKWLVRHGIAARDQRETIRGHSNVRLWVRKLFINLLKQPVVNKVFLRQDHIHVRFHNYYWESYYLDKSVAQGKSRIPRSFSITRPESTIKAVPQVLRQYESSLGGDDYPAHIAIPRAQWVRASFIEKRLAVHEFARQIVTRGWIWPTYPDYILNRELTRLRNLIHSRYLRDGMFNAHPPYGGYPPPGRRLLEHFFDISELWKIIASPRWTLVCLNELVKKEVVYDTHNFLRTTAEIIPKYSKSAPTIQDPAIYATIFKRLGISGRILDLSPNHGSRALACAINNLVYSTEPNAKVDLAIERGFCEFTGLQYEQHDGSTADLVILDNDLRSCSVSHALSYARVAKQIMVFVPIAKKNEYVAKYKPKSVVPIRSSLFRKLPDYLFLW